MPAFVAGLGPAKLRALVYLLAFVVFGALAIVGVLTLDDADRLFTLVGGALGMGTVGLSLKNIQKAPDVIDATPAGEPAADSALGRAVDALDALVKRLEAVGVTIGPAAGDELVDGAPYAAGSDPVLDRRLALEARASSQ